MFKKETGDWTRYRQLAPNVEIDFHYLDQGRREIPYWEAMDKVSAETLAALKDAYERGIPYVIFTHGRSTSRLGKTTARSQVRNVMRSSDATPYVIRSSCIQHDSVFVAAIRSPQT